LGTFSAPDALGIGTDAHMMGDWALLSAIVSYCGCPYSLYAVVIPSKRMEAFMNKKTLLATAIVISFTAPALADEYYFVRGPDRHCTVTTTKPTEQTTVTQIGPLAFESREKAEDRIRTTKVCSDDATTGSSVTIEKK
jgi:hypothetical protein